MKALILAATLLACAALARADEGGNDVKSTFDRFVAAQNAHDSSAVRELLLDSSDFLWITHGTPIWGREAAIKRFEELYKGTWKLSPDISKLKITALSGSAVQLFVPVVFNMGAPGQQAPDTPFLLNQTMVRMPGGWRIASILPIPVPPPAPPPKAK